MEFEWNEQKRRENLAKHGCDFADAKEFNWRGAEDFLDVRSYGGEVRINAVGFFRGKLCSVVYTERGGAKRLISFRRAGRRERREYYERKSAP